MPIYEYKCKLCQGIQEEIRPMGAGSEGLVCKRCGSGGMAKVYSVIARTPSVATGSEPCESMGQCPSGGCCHGCGEMA